MNFMGSREVPQKMWARSIQPFGRLLDTNQQQSMFIDEFKEKHF